MDGVIESRSLRSRSFLRTAFNLPPLLSVTGLILFWVFLRLFGSEIHIPIMTGDPKDVIPGPFMILGYLFLAGTILNITVWPLLCLFMSFFKRSIVPDILYGFTIWIVSGCSVVALWPMINWFLD